VTSAFISLRLDEDLLEDARRRAEVEDRSLSAVVRQSLRAYVEDSQSAISHPRDRSADPKATAC
jgi:predicted transcriptional regulator